MKPFHTRVGVRLFRSSGNIYSIIYVIYIAPLSQDKASVDDLEQLVLSIQDFLKVPTPSPFQARIESSHSAQCKQSVINICTIYHYNMGGGGSTEYRGGP